MLLVRRSTSKQYSPVTPNGSATTAAVRVAVPVEQLWHRVPGGTGRATRQTLIALSSITSVSTQGLAAWHRPSRRRLGLDIGPVTFVPIPRRVLYESWLRLALPSVERQLGPVDVVWASSMIPVPTAAPLVVTVHDLGFLDQPEHNSRRGRSFFPRAWAIVCERARIVVCPSQVVANDCRRHGINGARLRVVPWGVSPPLSTADGAEAVRVGFGLPERFALWVGTLEPRKNLPGLVEAVRRVSGLDLAVVGPPGWNLDGADVLAPLGDRVHRLGVVDDYQLSALYRAASVFVYPSFLEGFGLPVLEAMAHGTPVVASAGTATAEVAGGTARLVDPYDSGAIADAIEAALDDVEITEQLVVGGRERAQELTWAATAERYADIFTDVAKDVR